MLKNKCFFCMSLSPFDSFQSRFVTYLLNCPHARSGRWWKNLTTGIQSPVLASRSESLYRLIHLGPRLFIHNTDNCILIQAAVIGLYCFYLFRRDVIVMELNRMIWYALKYRVLFVLLCCDVLGNTKVCRHHHSSCSELLKSSAINTRLRSVLYIVPEVGVAWKQENFLTAHVARTNKTHPIFPLMIYFYPLTL